MSAGRLRQVSIGNVVVSPPIGLAPMAGYTSLPMRLLARRAGAGIVYTEMLSAEAMTRKPEYAAEHLVLSAHERPVVVQIFGGDPARLAEAAAMAEEAGASIIDLNLGCPAPKVMRSGAGAALAANPTKAARCLAAIKQAVRVPVTAKLRAGFQAGDHSYVELARRLEDAGAAALALHARTVEQAFKGRADWRAIARLVEAVSIPVLGNGDVKSGADALDMFESTGCGGVLIGRAAIGNPWLFSEVAAAVGGLPSYPDPLPLHRIAVALWYIECLEECYGRDALHLARVQLLPFIRGIDGAKRLRQEIAGARSVTDIKQAILRFSQKLSRRRCWQCTAS